MKNVFVLFTIITNISVAYCADEGSYFYKKSILSNNSNPSPLLTNIGYNWQMFQNVGFDMGYIDNKNKSNFMPSSPKTPHYQSIIGAALIQRSFLQFGTIYAKGGWNWTKEKHGEKSISFKKPYPQFSDIAPFLSIGANILTPMQKNLELNVELSYQNSQLNDPDAVFLIGAKYRF